MIEGMDAVAPEGAGLPAPYPLHVKGLPSLAGSISGVSRSGEPVAEPVMRPISWLPRVLVNVPPEVLMTPLKLGLSPAR